MITENNNGDLVLMQHKTFEDETFTLKNLNIKVNDLTETDPYVDRVVITPEEDAVDELGYSANTKEEKAGTKKDPITGIEFDATADETRDEKMSEIPEKLKKLQALLNDGKTVRINTNVGRYTSDDGSSTSFYITKDHIEEMAVETGEESANEEADNEEESANQSADSDEDTDEEEDSSTESSEGELDEQQRSALSEFLSANSVEEVKEYIDDILDDEKLDEYGGAEEFLKATEEAEEEGKDRKTVLEYVERQKRNEVEGYDSEEAVEEEENAEEDEEDTVIF